MFDLIENPRITNGSPSNHNTIYAVSIYIKQGFFWTINITVAKNWNLNPFIIFYFGNGFPVSLSFV